MHANAQFTYRILRHVRNTGKFIYYPQPNHWNLSERLLSWRMSNDEMVQSQCKTLRSRINSPKAVNMVVDGTDPQIIE